jgi:hypothetical protein
MRTQQIGRHHQQQHAARRAERRQPDADQRQKLDPAQREGEQHGGGRRRRDDRELSAVCGIHPRRQSQEHRGDLDRADGDEQRGKSCREDVKHG